MTDGATTRALTRLAKLLRVRLMPPVVVVAPTAPSGSRRARGRSARNALVAFAIGTLLLHGAMVVAMDAVWPQLADPEYGRRAVNLRSRVAEHPNRPLVVVVGSSRSAMGVKPGAWEAVRPGAPNDPLLFNMSAVGAGPITQLLTLRRVYADGFRPSVVLLEYWPPLLREDGEYAEAARIDPRRLRWDDRTVIRDYFPDPDATERHMRTVRRNVLSAHRDRLMAQAAPEWMARAQRVGSTWAGLDEWGWLPGMEPAQDDVATRKRLSDVIAVPFRDRFKGYAIHPYADRAIREAMALARSHGAEVGFVFLPESAEFRSWYPADVSATTRAHLNGLSAEFRAPVIDAREWMDDRDLADGFHLSRIGAAAFTARLGPAVAATFPATGRKP